LRYDAPLIVVIVALVAIGLMMVFSTTWGVSYYKFGSAGQFFVRQLVSLGAGLGVMAFFIWLPRAWWRWVAIMMIGATLLTLVYVVFRGGAAFGAQRGIQPGRFMPAELARLSTVFYLAVWLSSRGDKLHEWGYGMVPFAVIVGVIAGLVLLEPDISAAFTLVLVSAVMYFLAGADLRQMLASILAAGGAGLLVINSSTTARERLTDYLSGLSDLTQASWHVQQAIVAFLNGGPWGVGLGQSRQKFGPLPAPHTDSIFAVVGEELGLVGCLLIITLFVLLVWRGLKIASRAGDPLGSLLAASLVLWLGLEALINILVIVGLIPFAGNALPFISYGGSALVVALGAVGLLLNISRQGALESAPRKVVANFNFSRRDRRRRVSRAGRGERAA
ncbi:MAG: cell division protein FtsW, partial [Chloroflexi bacterium]|nr:cell division protein FtsW [Chloroflexota bacterium]